ncbi:Uncharacterized protein Rs2_50809 [Raphanus sativus]|nr:Uncharacterized protein Rs2_50809 [Raphanus sativus]
MELRRQHQQQLQLQRQQQGGNRRGERGRTIGGERGEKSRGSEDIHRAREHKAITISQNIAITMRSSRLSVLKLVGLLKKMAPLIARDASLYLLHLLPLPPKRWHSILSSSLRISNSCPVTPPLSSPTSKNPKPLPNWDTIAKQSMANAKQSMASFNYPFYAVSAPASPTHHRQFHAPATIPECDESDASTVDSGHWISFQKFAQQQPFSGSVVPTSPTFNLVKPPVPQMMSPNAAAFQEIGQSSEFKFENSRVKPWEGEMIHDVGMEDLELTLGNDTKPSLHGSIGVLVSLSNS